MKTILFCLLSIAAVAQKVASPPTLTYRQSNTNELNMIVSSAGQLLTPSSSMSITAEIRASDVGRIISTVSLSTVSSQDGTIKGILPDLAPNIYYLGLFVDYANGQPDFRVGVARIEILPTGSLRSITDASGLNVQISETKQVLDIKLDATPSASVAAYYAQQARAATDTVVTSVATIHTYANSAANSASAASTSMQTALGYKNSAQVSADSALIRATRTLEAKGNALLSEQNAKVSELAAQASLTIVQGLANTVATNTTLVQANTNQVANNTSTVANNTTLVQGLANTVAANTTLVQGLANSVASNTLSVANNTTLVQGLANTVVTNTTLAQGYANQAAAFASSVDTAKVINLRTQNNGLFSYITQYSKKKTLRLLYAGTSIANNTNSGGKAFLASLISQLGNSGNTTQHLGVLGGSYTASFSGWEKQPFSGFAFTRLRGKSTSTAISFNAYMSRYVLRYSKELDGGSFTVAVDGVVSATISCSGTQSFANEWVYTWSTPGQHIITINQPATGFAYLETQDFCLDQPGVHIMDASLGGSSIAGNMVNTASPSSGQITGIPVVGFNGLNSLFNNTSTNFKPDLAIVTWTVNDAGLGLSIFNTRYKPAMDSIVASCQRNNVQLVLVIEAAGHYSLPVNTTNFNTYNSIRNYLLTFRNYTGVTVLDWNAKMGLNTTNLATLKRLLERYYAVTNLNPATGAYDAGGDLIHPNDFGNSLWAEMLQVESGVRSVGRQGDHMQVAMDAARAHTASVSNTTPKLYSPSFLNLSGVTLTNTNGLGLTNSYRQVGSSVNAVSGRSEALWYSQDEVNQLTVINDSIATATTSDDWGKFRTYSNSNFYIQLPTSASITSRFTITLTIPAGKTTTLSINNNANTAKLPLFVQGGSFAATGLVRFENTLNEPQTIHITGDTYTTNQTFFLVVNGSVSAFYITMTDHACMPGKRIDQMRNVVPGISMVGDIPANRVINGQTYFETINGKTLEKVAIANNVYKPISSTIATNNWYGLYRLQNRTTTDIRSLTLTGTVSETLVSEKFGGVLQTTNASTQFVTAGTYTTAVAGQIYTVTGFVADDNRGVSVVLRLGSNYLSLQLDGTWLNVGTNITSGTNLLTGGHFRGRPVAFTFVMPDLATLGANSPELRVVHAGGGTPIGWGRWVVCEGSSATN